MFDLFQLHLSKLETVKEDDINREIHNIQCIYNALSDIKAEVENVIKVGRKIVEDNPDDGVKSDDPSVPATTRYIYSKQLLQLETHFHGWRIFPQKQKILILILKIDQIFMVDAFYRKKKKNRLKS